MNVERVPERELAKDNEICGANPPLLLFLAATNPIRLDLGLEPGQSRWKAGK
jgi:hypothetical protein